MHDLNNVFQTVTEAADLISSDPKWTSTAAIVLRGVDRGRRIVSSIIEADRPVCVRALLDSAVRFAEDVVAAMGGPALHFSIEVERNLSLTLRSSAIERALVNLFINSAQAARASGADSCSISIAAVSDENSVELTVSDDGPGIPESILPSIFSPRFSTRRNGAGLGLHIVESMITESGGSVAARNGMAGGAVFEIRLPSHARGRAEASLSR
jgi:C4-dicarboxylate-specific signal transduction histidine kinase